MTANRFLLAATGAVWLFAADALAQGEPPPVPAPAPAPPAPGDPLAPAPVPAPAPAPAPAPLPPPPAPTPVEPPPAGPPPGFGVEGTATPYAPPAWPAVPPPPPPVEPRRGVGETKDGIPLSQRGGLALDTAVFSAGNDNGTSGGALGLELGLPLAKRTFLDVRLPLGFSQAFVLGNPSLGVRQVIGRDLWVMLGGAIGVPALNEEHQAGAFYQVPPIPHGLWNMHDYFPNIVPLEFNLGLEGHSGYVILRGQLDPVLYIPYGDNDEAELVIQHAGELQFGHRIGGGVRLQGVAIPTGEDYGVDYPLLDRGGGDLYQLAFEPFFAAEGELLHARLGLMIPLDEQLGEPFNRGWGFRFKTGFRID